MPSWTDRKLNAIRGVKDRVSNSLRGERIPDTPAAAPYEGRLALAREERTLPASNSRATSGSTIQTVATASTTPASPPQPSAVLTKNRKSKVTTEELRELQELIRIRYTLDVEIWRDRSLLGDLHRDIQNERIVKAEAALTRMQKLVKDWDKADNFEPKDYKMFQDVKKRILADGKRNWAKDPPWDKKKVRETSN